RLWRGPDAPARQCIPVRSRAHPLTTVSFEVQWTRRKSLLAAVVVAGVLLLAWQFRWGIGLKAVEIVDPVVRRWASNEVRRLSEGVYQLTASPINVDVAL